MKTKTVLAFDTPFITFKEDNTVWVSVESLSNFLGLGYAEQVYNLSGDTSMRELGLKTTTTPVTKVISDEGRQYLCIRLEDVSLFAATATLDDLGKIDNQRHCRDDLPGLLAVS